MDFKTTVMHAEVDTLGGTILKSGKAAILDGQGVEFLQLWQPPPFLPPPPTPLGTDHWPTYIGLARTS